MFEAANKWLGTRAQQWPRWLQPLAITLRYTLLLATISVVVWLIAASERDDAFAGSVGAILCVATWLASILYGIARETLGKETQEAPFLLGSLASIAYPMVIYFGMSVRLGYLTTPTIEGILTSVAGVLLFGLVWKYCFVRGGNE